MEQCLHGAGRRGPRACAGRAPASAAGGGVPADRDRDRTGGVPVVGAAGRCRRRGARERPLAVRGDRRPEPATVRIRTRRSASPVVRVGSGHRHWRPGLAFVAARSGQRTALVDLDPAGGGLDLLVGAERLDGWRWPRLASARGHLGDLGDQLPCVDGVEVLSMGRGVDAVRPPSEAATSGAGLADRQPRADRGRRAAARSTATRWSRCRRPGRGCCWFATTCAG